MLLITAITASCVAVGIAMFKLSNVRDIDVLSVVSNVLMKSRCTNLMSRLGLMDALRPRTLSKVVTPNGLEFITVPNFKVLVGHVWNFTARENDVYVATYPKSGSTWVQEIVWLICNNADTETARDDFLTRRSPFLETVDVGDNLGIQTLEKWPLNSTRIMKVHRPYEILPADVAVKKKGKIIYVFRNPKDVCVSYFHFHDVSYSLPKPGSWAQFLANFSVGNVAWGDWFSHAKRYWQEFIKNPDHMLFITYESLKSDLRAQVTSIAKFLGKDLTPEQISTIAKHCSFASMKGNGKVNYEHCEDAALLDFSKGKFMRKGEVGDWKNYFTVNQSAAFDKLVEEKMRETEIEIRFELKIRRSMLEISL